MTDDAVLLKKRETATQTMLSPCTCFWVSMRSSGDKEGKWPSDAIDEFYSPLHTMDPLLFDFGSPVFSSPSLLPSFGFG
jgi:hypothetical protein